MAIFIERGDLLSVWNWFLGLFKADNTLELSSVALSNIEAEVFYKSLAVNSAINLIANTISNAEFITYEKSKEIRGDNYYLMNVLPNKNQNANRFWKSVIHKMINDNECLVVQVDQEWLIADDYNVKEYELKENEYENVDINGYELNEVFKEREVLRFELHDEKMISVIDSLFASHGKLIYSSTMHNLRKRAKRGQLVIPGSYPQTEEANEELEELLSQRFKTYFGAESGAVLPLSNDLEYNEEESHFSNNPSQEGRDIRAFIDDIFDFVALGFNIPPQLLKGDVADTKEAVDNFITFCINPLAELLNDEINRKYYTKEEYLERTYVRLDTTRLISVDISDAANALDVLTRIGVNSPNDSLRYLGREEIDEDWANERYVTKNYERAERKGDEERGDEEDGE